MEITKLGHCCLLMKVGDATILTDPGNYSEAQNDAHGIDLILITHEHADHLHLASLKTVLANNPKARIFTNSAVGKILSAEGIAHEVLEGTATTHVGAIRIEAYDGKHEEIFEEFGQVRNTGYLIADRCFYPGDSFTAPRRPVEILALPVAGPWCRLADAIRFALRVKPAVAFPVHDGMLQNNRFGSVHGVPSKVLPEHGVAFVPLLAGESHSF